MNSAPREIPDIEMRGFMDALLDLGKFDTPYGAEVAESHLNMNYTRGLLYASQPVFHTSIPREVPSR